jgi:hypothetical protein
MSIRLRYKLSVAVSSSQAEENDLGNTKYEVVSDSANEGGVWKTTVAAAATVTLNLDNIASAKFLMLRFTPKDPTLVMTALVLTLNGTIVLPPINPVGAAQDEAIFMISTSGITAVQIANTDVAAVAVDVIVGVAGD